MEIEAVGIVYKHDHKPAKIEAVRLERWLKAMGIKVFSKEMVAEKSPANHSKGPSLPKRLDWVIVLGGDGTLLGAAREIGKYGVPILGVNLGGLGFLTKIPLSRLYPVVEFLIDGKFEVETRVMLKAQVMRKHREIVNFSVLNDVVINKSTLARIIDLDVSIDDESLTTFRADGLIIATPTGSTAYNLAAGGPILYPTLNAFILTPICPFTLTNRPLIIPNTSVIKVLFGKQSEDKVVLTFDGQVGFDLKYGDEVYISKSSEHISLIKPPNDTGYFGILRTKLMWGGATYNNNKDVEASSNASSPV